LDPKQHIDSRRHCNAHISLLYKKVSSSCRLHPIIPSKNSEKFWLNLQNELDLREARAELAAELAQIHPLASGPHCVFLPFFFSQKENSVHPFPS